MSEIIDFLKITISSCKFKQITIFLQILCVHFLTDLPTRFYFVAYMFTENSSGQWSHDSDQFKYINSCIGKPTDCYTVNDTDTGFAFIGRKQ